MIDRLILFGAGGHAKVVAEAWLAAHPDGEIAILDDDPASVGATLLGRPIRGGRDWLAANWHAVPVAPGIGNNSARAALLAMLTERERPLASVIHPAAVVSPSARIGAGCFLAAGSVVNAEAELKEGVILNTGASIDHDGRIGRCAHVAPGARLCGNVTVGAGSLVGAGSALIPGVRIGARCVIGAGSVVIADIPDGATWAGCPARPL